jgi:hypothetical protein
VGRCGNFASLGTNSTSARALSLVAKGAWQIGQDTAGIAIDRANRVYIADGNSIFVVEGGTVGTYLTAEEARTSAGLPGSTNLFIDMARASDGSLYILGSRAILRSTAAHTASLWQTLTQTHFLLGVVANDEVAVIRAYDGLWSFTNGTSRLLYPEAALQGVSNCATQDIAISSFGVFLYQPGCNGSALMRGRTDGSSVSRLYEAEPFGINPFNATNFSCIAPDPLGGFYALAETPSGARLFHLCENATRFAGYNAIVTSPEIPEAAKQSSGLAFRYCSLIASEDGTVFVQTFNELWRVSPE